MKFIETRLKGAYIIEPEPIVDDRGFFARTFCQREFSERGLTGDISQCSVSFNRKAGTLRGMHYQVEPHAEVKLVRCTRGAIVDVIVDVRPRSATRLQWISVELNSENHRMLYIPKGFAHGFQTVKPDSEVFYQISEAYDPASARGVRWNDPALAIDWPIADPTMSDRDRNLPLVGEAEF